MNLGEGEGREDGGGETRKGRGREWDRMGREGRGLKGGRGGNEKGGIVEKRERKE